MRFYRSRYLKVFHDHLTNESTTSTDEDEDHESQKLLAGSCRTSIFINGACVAQSALPQLPTPPAANQATALKANQLLKPQYIETLTTGKVETPNGGKYAYGFQEATVNGTRCFGHGGGAPGMNGELKICLGQVMWLRCWRTWIRRRRLELQTSLLIDCQSSRPGDRF